MLEDLMNTYTECGWEVILSPEYDVLTFIKDDIHLEVNLFKDDKLLMCLLLLNDIINCPAMRAYFYIFETNGILSSIQVNVVYVLDIVENIEEVADVLKQAKEYGCILSYNENFNLICIQIPGYQRIKLKIEEYMNLRPYYEEQENIKSSFMIDKLTK